MRTCNLYRDATVLTIRTPSAKPYVHKRGKTVEPHHVSVYIVEDARPDSAVAWPALRLRKLTGNGETWTVHVDEHGASCSCYNQGRREQDRNQEPCKHICALRACDLIPGE